MTSRPLAFLGSGMICGVGNSAPTACAAIRCGMDFFRETRFRERSGEWLLGSSVTLDQPWRGVKRLAAMVAEVLDECLATDPNWQLAETPVLICLAEKERPGRFVDLERRLAEELKNSFSLTFHPDSEIVSLGAPGLGPALRQAAELIYEKKHPRVMIAGVDSFLVGATISAYEAEDRLLTEENSNGFIPGEAAAAVMVGRPVPDQSPRLHCLGLGSGVEEATEPSDKVLRADGLVAAIRGALQETGLSLFEVDFRVTDISGSQYGFKEASLALSRLLRQRREVFDIWHPSDCIGEVGAAIGPVILAVCMTASAKGYALGRNILCHMGNDNGARAAMVLSYQPGGNVYG